MGFDNRVATLSTPSLTCAAVAFLLLTVCQACASCRFKQGVLPEEAYTIANANFNVQIGHETNKTEARHEASHPCSLVAGRLIFIFLLVLVEASLDHPRASNPCSCCQEALYLADQMIVMKPLALPVSYCGDEGTVDSGICFPRS